MKQKALKNVLIRGIQCAVPRKIVKNDYFTSFFSNEEIEKSSSMTGVKSRRFADKNICTSDLCVSAARKVMYDLGWDPSTIDGIFFVTQTPDYRLPATSCSIQEKLGLSTECAAFDVNLGCSGYVYGLWLAANLMATGCMKRVLLLAGDTISKAVSPKDRSTVLLFGDAGSATALEFDENAPEMAFVLGTDGRGKENLIIPAGGFREQSSAETVVRCNGENDFRSREDLFMDGGEIFNFTIQRVPPLVKILLQETKKETSDVDFVVFHQANEFIMKHLAKKLKLNPNQAPSSIGHYGNTSSASIPLTIASELAQTLGNESKTVALVGFGVGYSWGGAMVELGPLASIGVLEV